MEKKENSLHFSLGSEAVKGTSQRLRTHTWAAITSAEVHTVHVPSGLLPRRGGNV